MPKLPSYLSTQLRNLLAHHERVLGHQLPVIVARQNLDGTEIEFANMLFEDANNDAYSYIDCKWWYRAKQASAHSFALRSHVGAQECNRRDQRIKLRSRLESALVFVTTDQMNMHIQLYTNTIHSRT